MPRLVSGIGVREQDYSERLVSRLLRAEQLPYLHERVNFRGPVPDFCVWSYRLATMVVVEVSNAIDPGVHRYKVDYLDWIEETFGLPTLFLDRQELRQLRSYRGKRLLGHRLSRVQLDFVRSGRRRQPGVQIQWLAHAAGLLPNPERARSVEH